MAKTVEEHKTTRLVRAPALLEMRARLREWANSPAATNSPVVREIRTKTVGVDLEVDVGMDM